MKTKSLLFPKAAKASRELSLKLTKHKDKPGGVNFFLQIIHYALWWRMATKKTERKPRFPMPKPAEKPKIKPRFVDGPELSTKDLRAIVIRELYPTLTPEQIDSCAMDLSNLTTVTKATPDIIQAIELRVMSKKS